MRFSRRGGIAALNRKRRVARELGAFTGMLEAPTALGSADAGSALTGAFSLPAGGWLAASMNQETKPGDLTVTVGGREFALGGDVAGRVWSLGWFEAGATCSVTSADGAPAGTITLHVLDQWRQNHPIATGEITRPK